MKKKPEIIIINGVNLNFLGIRETHLYGTISFNDYFKKLQADYAPLKYFQSNIEGEIVSFIQDAYYNKAGGVIINPGAFSHTSLAIADAISSVPIPCVEVHLTNIYAREQIRHSSLTAARCIGVISGFGLYSYHLALQFLINFIQKK